MSGKMTRLLILSLVSLLACEPAHRSNVPDELLGVWKTTEPKYADRFLQLTQDRIVFGTGKGSADSYQITRVVRIPKGQSVFYTLSYADREGQGYKLSLIYDSAHEDVIRLKNQNNISWQKETRSNAKGAAKKRR